MLCRLRGALVAAALLAASARAHATPDISLGGIIQPQLKWQQHDANANVANQGESGFVLRRARLIAVGHLPTRSILWEARAEADMVPGFQLLDAYLAANAELPKRGFWRITLGQHFAPFSRQTILSAADLQMVDFAQLVSLTPGRQIGISGILGLPYAPWLQVSGGVFNGKGINVVENIDSNFMYVGRVAFRPIGPRARLIESALGEDAVWVAFDISWNKKRLGDFSEKTLLLGADAFCSFKGFSAYVEYLWGDVTYTSNAPNPNYHLQGFNAQAGYLFPIPGWLFRRLEVTARFEAVAPNQSVPITGPGDPTQARWSMIGGLSYYHRAHNVKVQLNYLHNAQLDDHDAAGKYAGYANDQFLAQFTYRLE